MKSRVFSRRQFIEMCMSATAAMGLKGCMPGKMDSRHAKESISGVSKKPAVVWLEAQDCAGCTESVLACLQPDLSKVILDDVCFRYHETIMAGTGQLANYALEQAVLEGGYVLVVEGSFPEADPRFLKVAGEPLEDQFVVAANNAAAIVAVGACAAYGGIPRAGVPHGKGVKYFMDLHQIQKPLINLPGCPVHPIWFFNTVYTVLTGDMPALDQHLRPLQHFGKTIHDECPRRRYYDRGRFLIDWNNPSHTNKCLFKKGCKGPETHADCPHILWNEGANWCIGNNAPCAGCTEPKFYDQLSPLYVNPSV